MASVLYIMPYVKDGAEFEHVQLLALKLVLLKAMRIFRCLKGFYDLA